MPDVAIQIKHPAEISNGRNVFGTTRKLIIDYFGCGHQDVQIGVKSVVHGLDTLGSRHEIGIGHDEIINVAHAMQVLVFNLPDGFRRAIVAAIMGHKCIVTISQSLERQRRAIELPLDNRRLARIGDIPHLRLLRRIGKAVFVNPRRDVGLWIAKRHLPSRKRQLAPSVDDDIVDKALRGSS